MFCLLLGKVAMASSLPVHLDDFVQTLKTGDTHKGIAYEEIVRYLSCENTSMKCEDMDNMIHVLTAWIISSNSKVSLFLFYVEIAVTAISPLAINRSS